MAEKRRVLFLTATIHIAGDIVDSEADGYLLNNAEAVYETGELRKCVPSGKWSHAEPLGDGVVVFRGSFVAMVPLSSK